MIIATLMILIAIRISPIVQRYVRRKTYKKRTRLAIQLSSANGISKVKMCIRDRHKDASHH